MLKLLIGHQLLASYWHRRSPNSFQISSFWIRSGRITTLPVGWKFVLSHFSSWNISENTHNFQFLNVGCKSVRRKLSRGHPLAARVWYLGFNSRGEFEHYSFLVKTSKLRDMACIHSSGQVICKIEPSVGECVGSNFVINVKHPWIVLHLYLFIHFYSPPALVKTLRSLVNLSGIWKVSNTLEDEF